MHLAAADDAVTAPLARGRNVLQTRVANHLDPAQPGGRRSRGLDHASDEAEGHADQEKGR